MKKFSKLLFIAIFAIAVLFTGKNVQAEDVPYSTAQTCVVTASKGLFIYHEASYNSETYKDASTGKEIMAEYGWIVDVTAKNGNFYKIQFYYGDVANKAYGYVAASGVKLAKAPGTETFTKVYGYIGVAKYNAIDVRSTSNIKSVFKILSKGNKVNIVAQSSSWYKIQLKVAGVVKTGYVYRGLLTKTDALTKTYMQFTYTKSPKMKKKYTIKLTDKCPIALSGKKITWKSSNKSVVTISKAGKFKIKKSGNATLTCKVKVGNRSKTFKFKLKDNKTYKFYK